VLLKGTQDKFEIEENKLCCGSGFIESISGSRVLIAINCKKNTGEKPLSFIDQKVQFTYPRPP
jgi:hypothetical protein